MTTIYINQLVCHVYVVPGDSGDAAIASHGLSGTALVTLPDSSTAGEWKHYWRRAGRGYSGYRTFYVTDKSTREYFWKGGKLYTQANYGFKAGGDPRDDYPL